MDVILTNESIIQSVQDLDDRQLIRQIIECQQIHQTIIGKTRRYINDPAVQHYGQYPEFIIYYGYFACQEFEYRFEKQHKYHNYFKSYLHLKDFQYQPVFIKESYLTFFQLDIDKKSALSLLSFDNIHKSYQLRLSVKWDHERKTKWTKRKAPQWYHKGEFL